ncbi:MAG: hypothetical protein GX838_05250 [Clostridiaceae bacterium]|nr:hypothetical protein [Clostridiaceae bacterium]
MPVDWDQINRKVATIAGAMRRSRAPAIYGLWELSLEEQRLAFRLAEALGAYISVTPRLSPTLTVGAISRAPAVILVGGSDLPSEIVLTPDIPVIRCDVLAEVQAWPSLHASLRGRALGNDRLPELGEVVELMCRCEPVLVFRQAVLVPELFDWLNPLFHQGRLLGAMQWEGGQDVLGRNAAGAYEIALEEAGGAASVWSGGMPHADRHFDVVSLCDAKVTDLVLRLGESAVDPCLDGIPLIAIGPSACPSDACDGLQSAVQAEEEYTILRPDGMVLTQYGKTGSPYPPMRYVLQGLLSEVKAC